MLGATRLTSRSCHTTLAGGHHQARRFHGSVCAVVGDGKGKVMEGLSKATAIASSTLVGLVAVNTLTSPDVTIVADAQRVECAPKAASHQLFNNAVAPPIKVAPLAVIQQDNWLGWVSTVNWERLARGTIAIGYLLSTLYATWLIWSGFAKMKK